MPILRRNLTVHFQKSVKVTSAGVTPQSVEVTVIPLQDASNAETVATYVGGPQTQTSTLLYEDNPVTFSLVPSNIAGLSNPINYRIMWRVGGVTGRTETYDFAMPDVDITFDQLHSTSAIINGEVYLQQIDLGTRVAALNDSGNVVDSEGVPVATLADVAEVQDNLDVAVGVIEQARQTTQSSLLQTIGYEVGVLRNTLTDSIQQSVTGLNNLIKVERDSRTSALNTLSQNLSSLTSSVNSSTASFSSSISNINNTLLQKADLSDGYVPISQIPPEAITNWIPLTSASLRFNLSYPDDIQRGDIVLSPTGLYGLIGTNPANESSWYLLNQILSVNGKHGNVVLTASDVGAIASDASIPISQIAGLSTSLSNLTPKTTSDSLQSQIVALREDPKIVRLNSSNQISHLLLNEFVAYVNVLGQVTKKDGTVIADPADRGVLTVNGKSGTVTLVASDVGALATNAVLPQSQITGLVSALAGKASLVSGTVPLSQLPTIPQSQIENLTTSLAGKASLSGGLVPLSQLPSIPQSQVSGLSAIISGNSLTSVSNAVNRLSSLEGRVSTLEINGAPGGGGGGGTTITTSVFWNGLTSYDTLDLTTVTLGSPFGIYSSGVNAGRWYYNKNGVPSGDAAFPIITPNGHLKLYKRNESNDVDPDYALESDLTTLSNTVASLGSSIGSKAEQADLNTQTARINSLTVSKADLDLTTNTLSAAQIPFLAKPNPKIVSSTAAMRAFTTSQVHAGDICIVSGTGTYTLLGNNPSQINNVDGWSLHPVPASSGGGGGGSGTVVSVSGPTGTKIYPDGTGNISLAASDIGAVSTSALAGYVTSAELTTALTPKTSIADVYNAIGTSQSVRNRVDFAVRSFSIGATTYCATGVPVTTVNGVTAPSGSPIIDKDAYGNAIYAPNNALVLLTNQSDSKQNGIWKVSTSGSWSRPTDAYASGTRVFPGTLVIVNNSSDVGGLGTAGTTKYTIWQNISTAIIDNATTGATTWKNLGSMAPISVTGTGGVSVTGQYPNLTVGADVAGGFVRKFNVTVTPTSTSYTVNHGLNTMYPQVTVIENISNSVVLVGWKVGPANVSTGRYDTVILEFSATSYNNSYRISVHG